MKKLLVLLLVASLTALANGTILDISVNGLPTNGTAPYDTGINLVYSDTLLLDITSSTGYTPGDDVYFALVSSPTGTISGGVVHVPPAPDLSQMLGVEWAAAWTNTTDLGIYGQFMSSGMVAGPTGTFVDEILFHCEGGVDAVISLYTTPDFVEYTLKDSIIIHQPEPATIALLSLGGLLLRKKR